MTTIRSAFYARVSSEQQAAAHTIESQTAALSERAQSDGTSVPPERQFVDDGYSGATLIRPALDRLRDLATVGAIDRIYVHSPDRLARNYAYQVLLLDEWRRGVELGFLNRPLGQSPEDDLLLQVQGIVAEYERAKIMERSRRGKKHAAQSGSLNVMSNAPFGYSYVSVREGGGQARFELVAEQARIVREIFSWIGRDRCSLAEVCRRLQKAGELTATGKRIWSRQAVWHILQNPAYQGRAAYGKTHMMPRRRKARPRAARGWPAEPRRSNAPVTADPKEWVFAPVPAITPCRACSKGWAMVRSTPVKPNSSTLSHERQAAFRGAMTRMLNPIGSIPTVRNVSAKYPPTLLIHGTADTDVPYEVEAG